VKTPLAPIHSSRIRASFSACQFPTCAPARRPSNYFPVSFATNKALTNKHPQHAHAHIAQCGQRITNMPTPRQPASRTASFSTAHHISTAVHPTHRK
jgi:hypothetical protein